METEIKHLRFKLSTTDSEIASLKGLLAAQEAKAAEQAELIEAMRGNEARLHARSDELVDELEETRGREGHLKSVLQEQLLKNPSMVSRRLLESQAQHQAALRDKKLLAANVSVLRYALGLQPVGAVVAMTGGDSNNVLLAARGRMEMVVEAERRAAEAEATLRMMVGLGAGMESRGRLPPQGQ